MPRTSTLNTAVGSPSQYHSTIGLPCGDSARILEGIDTDHIKFKNIQILIEWKEFN